MATANNTGAGTTDEATETTPDEPPPYNLTIKDKEFPRKESQNSFVSIDLDFQDRVFSAGYDQENTPQNTQSYVQYDENFYQPTLQPYTNLGKKRSGYTQSDMQTTNRHKIREPWCDSTMQTKLHIQISQQSKPITDSGPRPFDQSDKYHTGYDQNRTPTIQTNFNIGFTHQRASNSQVPVIEQPKAQFFNPDKPYTMLIPAVFACVCFFPTGIVAIISAMNAKNAIENGDLPLAAKYTRMAQRWTFCSVVIGIVWMTATIVAVTTYS